MRRGYRFFDAAITGIGVVTSAGIGKEAFAANLFMGRQHLSPLEGMQVPRGKGLAAKVDEPAFDAPGRAVRMASAALDEAAGQAGIALSAGNDTGMFLATIGGDSGEAENFHPLLSAGEGGGRRDLRRAVISYPNGALLNSLCRRYNIGGPRLLFTNACASGNIAIGMALDYLRTGRCSTAMVVGVDILKPSMIWGADRAGFLGRSLRPFHALRDGAVLGEGAGALILQHPDAVRRGKRLANLAGFNCVCDRGAAAITLAADDIGLLRSMRAALCEAFGTVVPPDYINAHAPGTKMIDMVECAAIASLSRETGKVILFNSTKSVTGHLSGASPVVEVVAAVMQIISGRIHPTSGLNQPDGELEAKPVGETEIRGVIETAVSNACGGGGVSSSVVITAPATVTKYKPSPPQRRYLIAGSGIINCSSLWSMGAVDGKDAPPPKAQAEFDIYRYYPAESGYGYYNRAAQIGAAVAAIAIGEKNASLLDAIPASQVGVFAGTCLGGGPEASAVLCEKLATNPAKITPNNSLDHGIHLGGALVCRHYGYTGPTYTCSGSPVSGLHALDAALVTLDAGRCAAAVVMAYDAVHPIMRRAASRCRLYDADYIDAGAALVLHEGDVNGTADGGAMSIRLTCNGGGARRDGGNAEELLWRAADGETEKIGAVYIAIDGGRQRKGFVRGAAALFKQARIYSYNTRRISPLAAGGIAGILNAACHRGPSLVVAADWGGAFAAALVEPVKK